VCRNGLSDAPLPSHREARAVCELEGSGEWLTWQKRLHVAPPREGSGPGDAAGTGDAISVAA